MSSFRGRHVGTHRTGRDIEAAGQLLLRQRLGVEQGEQLLESGVGQLDHEGGIGLLSRNEKPMLTRGH